MVKTMLFIEICGSHQLKIMSMSTKNVFYSMLLDKINQHSGIFQWALVGTKDGIVRQQEKTIIPYLIDFI